MARKRETDQIMGMNVPTSLKAQLSAGRLQYVLAELLLVLFFDSL